MQIIWLVCHRKSSSLIKFSRKEDGMLDQFLKNKWWDGAQRERKWQSFNFPEYQAQRELEKYFAQ